MNLFSQQIVDQNVLVSRVESFIGGNSDLFEWFKNLVGYDGTDEIIENMPRMQPLTKNAGGCGPSYRHVPKAWQNRTCSGRDALCWDVLNDTYISHPTWASEDTGYVASKKNQYEEALHRVEEERYDYDLNIEANLNTIALLEPIAKKISIMSADEKSSFRLSPGLGSPSRTIYQRIMKKIYANKGLEMIDLLHNNPAQTVPIVLKRLKQKDDEWKRAQREWNKIWREVEAKNYWKSLDYQGITFKLTDRKAMTTRSLVAEAEVVKESYKEDKFQFEFTDIAVFKDVSRLVYFYLDRQPVYNPEDCASMRVFMNTMIPLFFNVTDVEPSTVESGDIVMEEILDDDTSSVQSDSDIKTPSTNAARATSRRPRRVRGQLNDDDGLLKDVLTRNIKKKKSSGRSISSSEEEDEEDEDEEEEEDDESSQINNNTEDEDLEEEDEDEDEDDEDDDDEANGRSRRPRRRAARSSSNSSSQRKYKKPLRTTKKKAQTSSTSAKMATLASLIETEKYIEPENQKIYNFYGDNGFYCFFRLYQILYNRLCKMKALDTEFRENPEKAKKAHKEARDLGITPKRFKGKKISNSPSKLKLKLT